MSEPFFTLLNFGFTTQTETEEGPKGEVWLRTMKHFVHLHFGISGDTVGGEANFQFLRNEFIPHELYEKLSQYQHDGSRLNAGQLLGIIMEVQTEGSDAP